MDMEIVKQKKSRGRSASGNRSQPRHPIRVVCGLTKEEKAAKDACIMCIFHTYRDNVCKSVYRSSMDGGTFAQSDYLEIKV